MSVPTRPYDSSTLTTRLRCAAQLETSANAPHLPNALPFLVSRSNKVSVPMDPFERQSLEDYVRENKYSWPSMFCMSLYVVFWIVGELLMAHFIYLSSRLACLHRRAIVRSPTASKQ